jgi:hypothetical protein
LPDSWPRGVGQFLAQIARRRFAERQKHSERRPSGNGDFDPLLPSDRLPFSEFFGTAAARHAGRREWPIGSFEPPRDDQPSSKSGTPQRCASPYAKVRSIFRMVLLPLSGRSCRNIRSYGGFGPGHLYGAIRGKPHSRVSHLLLRPAGDISSSRPGRHRRP